jgi:hypothetical protein
MRTFSLPVLLMSATLCRADVAINPQSIDLGDVRGGTTRECVFQLKNAGSQTVELIDLERGCGCLEPRWSTRSLKPGETGTLAVRIRTLGQMEGPRSWPLTLVTRAAAELKKQPLEIKGAIRNEIVMQPPQVALFVTNTLEQEITLLDRRERPLAVTSWDAKMPGVRVEQLASKPGTTRLKLTVNGRQLPVGRHEHVLHLYTNDALYGHLEVPVTLVRVEPARVAWSPETPEVILAPGQNKGSVLVRIASRDGAPLAVEKIDGGDAGLTCAWSKGPDAVTVRVTVDRTQFTRAGVQSSIRLTAGGESIAIPIVVRIE